VGERNEIYEEQRELESDVAEASQASVGESLSSAEPSRSHASREHSRERSESKTAERVGQGFGAEESSLLRMREAIKSHLKESELELIVMVEAVDPFSSNSFQGTRTRPVSDLPNPKTLTFEERKRRHPHHHTSRHKSNPAIGGVLRMIYRMLCAPRIARSRALVHGARRRLRLWLRPRNERLGRGHGCARLGTLPFARRRACSPHSRTRDACDCSCDPRPTRGRHLLLHAATTSTPTIWAVTLCPAPLTTPYSPCARHELQVPFNTKQIVASSHS
jgi:hypothetical protein